jgi:acetate kinase
MTISSPFVAAGGPIAGAPAHDRPMPAGQPGDVVLVLNAGSSSLKFQTYALAGTALRSELRGQIDGIGADAWVKASSADGTVTLREDLDDEAMRDPGAALAWLSAWIERQLAGRRLVCVGHRVVHGGSRYTAPVRVDEQVLAELEKFVPLAPLHQPNNLAPIRKLMAARPELPQVACFDTAFHRTQPKEAEMFGLPRHFYDEGIRRYGFHGLSYQFVARSLQDLAPEAAIGRTVVAHLGSGVSMCALHHGRSVATTMGFTALDGCPMGTRPGALDAGVVLHLARERGMSLDAIEKLLYQQSGLLGLSGISNDMRELLRSEAPAAREAVDYFVYRLSRELGSLAAALGGLNALVFTAGIGENSPEIRAAICARAAWLGVELDDAANAAGDPRISRPHSAVSVWCLPTDEERMIAEQACTVLALA